MAGVYFLSSHILLRNYAELEKRETVRNVQRVTDELSYQLREMHANASDWSNWDDTYQFMADKNQPFIQSNLTDVLLNLDIMVFLDARGQVFYSKQLPRRGHRPPPGAEEIRGALGFGSVAGGRLDLRRGFTGLVTLKDGQAIMISVRPIVRTSGAGPARGWTVFGLRLDESELANLAQRSHLSVDIYDARDPYWDSVCKEADAHLTPEAAVYTKPLSDKEVAGYAWLTNIFGRPAKLLRVSDSRAIYAQGLESRRYLMQFITVAGIVFSIVILWVFEVSALSRVSKLRLQVERIYAGEGEHSHISLAGKDELSWLAQVIDLSSTVGSEAWNSRDLKSRPH